MVQRAPVTANDFVYAWRREVDPATASEYCPSARAHRKCTGHRGRQNASRQARRRIDGPQTLVVHLKRADTLPFGAPGKQLSLSAYEPAVKQWGDAWTQPGHMVSNGPFYLVRARPQWPHHAAQEFALLGRGPRASFQGELQSSSMTSAAMNQYLAGDLDFTDRIPTSEKGPAAAASWAIKWCSLRISRRPCSVSIWPSRPSKESKVAAGAEHGPGPRHSCEVCAARHRSARLQHHAAAAGIRSCDSRLGQDFRRTSAMRWRESSISKRVTRDSHPLETVLTYPSGGPDMRRLHGSAVGDVADEFGRQD